jgi:hypothetical protein
MFQSFEYQKSIGYDTATKEHRYQYKIIDSDFEEIGVGVVAVVGVVAAVGVAVVVVVGVVGVVAVIDTYEKRNLNVAANLMLAILYESKKYGYSVQQFINWNKQYNTKFAKYEKELEKYMVLL